MVCIAYKQLMQIGRTVIDIPNKMIFKELMCVPCLKDSLLILFIIVMFSKDLKALGIGEKIKSKSCSMVNETKQCVCIILQTSA